MKFITPNYQVDNIQIVNRTIADLSMLDDVFAEAYKAKVLREDYSDLFKISFLEAYNSDGSDRMLIDFA